MTSRTRGLRGGLSATRSDDVVDILRGQHAQIRKAFRRAALPGPARPRAFRDLVRLLAVHEAAEEAHVHPMVRRAATAGRAVAAARGAEEKEVKQLLSALRKKGPRGDGYLPALRALRRVVLAHARREERQEFPALLRQVSPVRRRVLGVEVRLARVLAPTRPHPLVNGELATKLTAPVLGPMDRGLDLLRRATARR